MSIIDRCLYYINQQIMKLVHQHSKLNKKELQKSCNPLISIKNLGLTALILKSDRRGSNPRSRPWQGRALPTTPLSHKAGDGNRTHVSSLEGWCSTIELHPHILKALIYASFIKLCVTNRGDRIRTCDPLIPNQVL